MSKDPKGSEIDTYALLTNMAQQNNNLMGNSTGAAGNLPPGFMDAFTGMGGGDAGGFQPGQLTSMFASPSGMMADLDPFSRLAMDFDNGNLQGGLFGQMLANPNLGGGLDLFSGGGFGFGFGDPQGPGMPFGAPQGPGLNFDPMNMHGAPFGTDPMMGGPLAGGMFGDPNAGPGFMPQGLGEPAYPPQNTSSYGPGYDYQQQGYSSNQQFGHNAPAYNEPFPGFAGPGGQGGINPVPPGFDHQFANQPFHGHPGGYQSGGYSGYPPQQGYMQGPSY